MGHVTIINCFIFLKTTENGPPRWHTIAAKFSIITIVLIASAGICPEWQTKIFNLEVIT